MIMKFIKEYLKEVMLIQPLGEIKLEDYEIEPCEVIGQELLIAGKRVGIIIYWSDYAKWLEKKLMPYVKQETSEV